MHSLIICNKSALPIYPCSTSKTPARHWRSSSYWTLYCSPIRCSENTQSERTHTGIHQQRWVADNALYLQITVSLAHVHVDYQTQKTLYTRNW